MDPRHTSAPPAQGDLWKEWAAKAQNGDKVAYRALLNDILPFIRNVLLRRVANPEWAEDIMQEVLISVHKSLKTYDPSKSFRPWLMAIITFRKADFLRKYYSQRDDKKTSLDNPEFLYSHVTKPTYLGEYKDVEKFLNTLPDRQKTVFRMMKIEGYSAQEIANETGMSISAVKVSAHRTLKKLRKALR